MTKTTTTTTEITEYMKSQLQSASLSLGEASGNKYINMKNKETGKTAMVELTATAKDHIALEYKGNTVQGHIVTMQLTLGGIDDVLATDACHVLLMKLEDTTMYAVLGQVNPNPKTRIVLP